MHKLGGWTQGNLHTVGHRASDRATNVVQLGVTAGLRNLTQLEAHWQA